MAKRKDHDYVTLDDRYIIRKHYRTDRSKTHTGWDVFSRNEAGEYVQGRYFSHFATFRDAVNHCGSAIKKVGRERRV